MKGTMSMRVIFTIVLLLAVALLVAIFYSSSLSYVTYFVQKFIVLK